MLMLSSVHQHCCSETYNDSWNGNLQGIFGYPKLSTALFFQKLVAMQPAINQFCFILAKI
jgi:hypothetical protein